ncbi:RNA polymerase sigma-28 (SigD/FliA/WhiG) subunit [Biostraticola tofi]|uniref:RNA polymerase sigma factor FliA n=2 Tax=Biostraticola tofi TaxID=466109 RepID=A0A4R3YUV4_9GAMM|nr:RNA polymerase sigma-28 (SigD/FliA/WhiG) subunit [Biostraticola tofi]
MLPGQIMLKSLYTEAGVVADKDAIWLQYAPLVRHEALRLQARLPASVELNDLIQAGGIGLLAAADSYDPQQGASFTTYATQRIRWALLDELRERDWVPRSVRRNARQISAAMQRVEQRLGRSASETEVAAELDVSLADYQKMLQDNNSSQLFSLDEMLEEQGETVEVSGEELVQQGPLQQLLQSGLRQRVAREIGLLPSREQLVLNLYYQQELNLKEIGSILGVGESRVSQLHSQAVNRLRARLQSHA